MPQHFQIFFKNFPKTPWCHAALRELLFTIKSRFQSVKRPRFSIDNRNRVGERKENCERVFQFSFIPVADDYFGKFAVSSRKVNNNLLLLSAKLVIVNWKGVFIDQ